MIASTQITNTEMFSENSHEIPVVKFAEGPQVCKKGNTSTNIFLATFRNFRTANF